MIRAGNNQMDDKELLLTVPNEKGTKQYKTSNKEVRRFSRCMLFIIAATLLSFGYIFWSLSSLSSIFTSSSGPLMELIVTDITPGCENTLLTNIWNISDEGVTYNASDAKQCDDIKDDFRFDCYPEDDANQVKCEARGCCWVPKITKPKSSKGLDVPFCYYPTNYPGYYYLNSTEIENGVTIFIERNTTSYYGGDVMLLKIDITAGNYGIRTKIYDPFKKRFEVPYELKEENDKLERSYEIRINRVPFVMKVIDKKTRNSVISTFPFLIYTDQFIQLPVFAKKHIYGLGERKDSFRRSLNWERFVLFAADQPPMPNLNLYGSQPFILNTDGNEFFMGTLIYNSNAMEFVLQPAPAYTIRTLGGILDVYSFIGGSAAEVVQQYQKAIGLPNMPPYWSLGFHLCRFGLKSAKDTRDVLQRNRDAGIPLDVQWNDIDYMDNRRDFTVDAKNYGDLANLVDDIHKAGMHYIFMMDSALDTPKDPSEYQPWADGLKRRIFINDSDGNPFIGKVWSPTGAAWPDFTNPKTTDFWTDHLNDLHKKIPYDGLWIDMNEPSNFYNGFKDGCPKSKYDNPPYVPHVAGGQLYHKTLCMTARQAAGIHYDVHNLYGYAETIATNNALQKIIPGKRPFIISRSTFPGHGKYGNHWTGDVFSTWDDLKASIAAILDFNLFGIPMVGADICGFNGNTTVKLCQRWMELGAFYPFARNHNTDDAIDQDPAALGPEVINSSRAALTIRYMLLPYLYTLFHRAHTLGETVARPLFFEFPTEQETYSIDTQFLLGPAVLVIPVLEEDQTTTPAYIPKGPWYLWGNFSVIQNMGHRIILDTPPGKINIALRGGFVFPIKPESNTTTQSRTLPYSLIFALDNNTEAIGSLYSDDGESLNAYEDGKYNDIRFIAASNTIKSMVVTAGATEELNKLEKVTVLGLYTIPKEVVVNGESTKSFKYDNKIKVLVIEQLDISLAKEFIISWK